MNVNQKEGGMADPETDRPDKVEDVQVKPFARLLQETRQGALHNELSELMQDLVTTCTETGKKGTLTLKITVSPQKDELTYLVTDDVTLKAPKPTRAPALFFNDGDGNLVRQDPRQLDIGELRAVEAPTAPLRDLPTSQEASP